MWTNANLEVGFKGVARGYVIALCKNCMSALRLRVGDAFVRVMVCYDETRRDEAL